MMSSARLSGTSISEKRSAISIAPSDRDSTPASPVIAPTRSPGRMPACRPAPMNRRTLGPSGPFDLARGGPDGPRPFAPVRPAGARPPVVTRGLEPAAVAAIAAILARRAGRGRNFLVVAVAGHRRVRHLHRRRRDVDDVELLRQRFDDDADVIEVAGEQLLAQRRARQIELPRAHVGDGRHRRDLDLRFA